MDSAAIVASVDSGCRETFEKIKGTKFYDIVLKNMKTYLNHARKKDFVISKFILLTNYNDSAIEVDSWLRNCKNIGHVEVQFDSEHSVSSSEHCENKKYVNRTLKMLKYTELSAKKFNLKVTSFLAFMNRAHKIYEQQLSKENQYKYCNISVDDFVKEKIDTLIKDEQFSPKRRASLKINKNQTIDEELSKKLMNILRLGFYIDIEKYVTHSVIDEIIKTSYSNINYIIEVKKILHQKTPKSSRLLKNYLI